MIDSDTTMVSVVVVVGEVIFEAVDSGLVDVADALVDPAVTEEEDPVFEEELGIEDDKLVTGVPVVVVVVGGVSKEN
jgi:hypothetical protein